MIPDNFIQELLNRVDIVDVVSKVVPLKKTGKNLMGCCPFHHEKTPSFSVNPQKQFFKCFGCGAAGTVIRFVMNYDGLTFPEAVRKLAESVGMEVPEERPGEKAKRERAKTLTDRMQMAADFYTEALRQNERAIDYLKGRGISGLTAARYGLGYSPDAWQSLKDVFGDQYEDPEMTEESGCGLVIVKEQGRRYDRFRGRLMFPIRNPRGQVIGFGARTLNGDEHPKYLNSPETAIYHKGLEIYGLYEAADTIRKNGRAIVCEGYMDVIQLSQAGFTEAVAALGTSITSDHVRKLLKMVSKVYFSFDGDSAGQHALRRAMEAALPVVRDAQEVRFVVLPEEHDPDSLIKEKGAHAFEEQLDRSLTLSEFFVHTLTEGKNLGTAEGRTQLLAEAKPLLVGMREAPLLRTQILGVLGRWTQMTPDAVARALGIAQPTVASQATQEGSERVNWKRDWTRPRRDAQPRRIVPAGVTADKNERILQYFITHPAIALEYSAMVEEEIVERAERGDSICEQIVEVWRVLTAMTTDRVPSPAALLLALRRSEHIARYEELAAREFEVEATDEVVRAEFEMIRASLELETLKGEMQRVMAAPNPDLEIIGRLVRRERVIREHIEQTKRKQSMQQRF